MMNQLQHSIYVAAVTAMATLINCAGMQPTLGQVTNAPETQTESSSTTRDTENGRDQTSKSDSSAEANLSEKYADDDSPALGVIVGSCPGGGVCVIETVWGSPAARAGIEMGDYILSINDQDISSPQDLRQKLKDLSADDTVNVSVWRQGETVDRQVVLAKEAESLPGNQRGWLGVRLADGSSGGSDREKGDREKIVTIEQVTRNSPAANAGLQVGDEVKQINGRDVESLERFVETVQEFEPGTQVVLTVQRGGIETQISVVLGDVGSAPMHWFRESFQKPLDEDMPMALSSGSDVLDEIIDDMRQQIRSLQEQVEQLKKPIQPPVDSSLDGVEDALRGKPNEDDVSTVEPINDRSVILAQYNSSRGFAPNISNDWYGSRYGNRGARGLDNRYREGYRSSYPNYGYPNYRYQYYNYGGRPYYYGGALPYRYRGGVRIGNLGIWW